MDIMTQFSNSPSVKDEHGSEKVKRYVHQPLTFDHFGIHVTIKENGHVLITSVSPDPADKESVIEDEIEVPASLIFKIAQSLKLTRTVQFVDKV
jgi:hypothetical protein